MRGASRRLVGSIIGARLLGWIALGAIIAAAALASGSHHAAAAGGVRPLCSLSTSAAALVDGQEHRLGVAVIDLRRGIEWTGGDRAAFALHSVVKVPIAWLALTRMADEAETGDDPRHARLRRQIGQMLTYSANEPVPAVLRYAGSLPALGGYYEQLGVPEMLPEFHPHRWGIGQAPPLAVARMLGALSELETAADHIREQVFAHLSRAPHYLRWGATQPPEPLKGWQSLIKTGWYLWHGTEQRINSAAIWLDEDNIPRYVIVMMMSGAVDGNPAQQLQNQIGAALGKALATREHSQEEESWNCLQLSIDLLIKRYF